jgi:hypothetical protein
MRPPIHILLSIYLAACAAGEPAGKTASPDLSLDDILRLDVGVLPDEGPRKPLELLSPENGAVLLVGREVKFAGRTACKNATLELVADGKFPFGTVTGVSGNFSYAYAFNTPGKDRAIIVSISDENGCCGSVSLTLTVQPARAHRLETLKDKAGCSYQLHTVTVPLADPELDLAVTGSPKAKTVAQLAKTHGATLAAVNAGYFAASSGPLSYAKGHTGYESPSGNVKGPRACLVYDRKSRKARVELSMGRQPAGDGWGKSLYPTVTDVACGGPQLLQNGANVAMAHVASEKFQTSGINPKGAAPRTAACILESGALLLAVAQSATVKACGPDLASLADLLEKRGCVDAINLDGGGSSALWFAGPPVVYHAGTEDRPVYQALLVHALP